LASLAGVSVDYYTRLEQGRPITPSEAVLDAIAAALRLDPAEREYLHTVARRSAPVRRRGAARAQSVRPGLLALMDLLGDSPALILGRRTDVLAANRMARLLLADFNAMPARDRNAARWLILDEGPARCSAPTGNASPPTWSAPSAWTPPVTPTTPAPPSWWGSCR
jgi:transcriptional regulator with XRE-family HTH domain